MPVFRVQKSKNYTVMSNYHLKDKNISFKAKGMLSFMLSLPDDWDYSLNGLCSVSKEGLDSIKGIVKELEKNKYLEIRKSRNDKGKFEYEYLIYERPYNQTAYISSDVLNTDKECKKMKKNQSGKSTSGYPISGRPMVENDIQINTKELITKKKKEKGKKRNVYQYEVETMIKPHDWEKLYDNE